MFAITQDSDYVYIDRSQLLDSDYPNLSENARLYDQVMKAFRGEIEPFNNILFSNVTPNPIYRYINQNLMQRNVLIITIKGSPEKLDPDEVV